MTALGECVCLRVCLCVCLNHAGQEETRPVNAESFRLLSCVGVEDYIHRIGRTGRAGASGESHTFLTSDDAKHARSLSKVATAIDACMCVIVCVYMCEPLCACVCASPTRRSRLSSCVLVWPGR